MAILAEGAENSRSDDFFLEAAGGDDQENRADREEGEAVGPELGDARSTEDDAASDVDEIACGDEIADDVKKGGHGLAREDVAREENAGEKGQEAELDGFRLRVGLAGNENADGKRNEKVRKENECEKKNAARNGNLKDKAHGGDNRAEFGKTDGEVGKELAEKKAHGADGRDEQLFERAALLLTHDGECGEERGDVQQQNSG